MPSVSGKQRRFMAMCAHSPQHARGKCPPKKVAREYNDADQAESPQKSAIRKKLKGE